MNKINHSITKEKRDEIRKQAEYEADRCRRELDLGIEPISDIFEIIERQKILLLRYPSTSENLSALIAKDEDDFSMIYINSSMPLGRQIFSAAHEYAHFKYHLNDKNCWICQPGDTQSQDPEEIFADSFAGRFLLPPEGVKKLFFEMFGAARTVTPFMVIRLQYAFKVSFAAMLYSLMQNKIIAPKAYGFLKKIGEPGQSDTLNDYTKRLGYDPVLMESTEPKIPNALLHALQENYSNGKVTYRKVESILENWQKKPEDYGIEYCYDI